MRLFRFEAGQRYVYESSVVFQFRSRNLTAVLAFLG